MPKRRGKRGSVHLDDSSDRLRLRFVWQGQRYVIGLGLNTANPWHRHLASQRQLWLERIIQYGDFDPTQIDHYREVLRGEDTCLSASPTTQAPLLTELWLRYQRTKVGKKGGTVRGYEWVERHIERLPHDLNQPQAILDAMTALTPDVQKRLLTQLSACCQWSEQSGLITTNPFLGKAKAIKVPQRGTTDEEISPFSRTERDQIIAAFQGDRHYHHYAPLVEFLFFTGARPSEAIALDWQNVRPDHILFNKVWVYSGHRYQLQQGLKTQASRKFPLNNQIDALLKRLHRPKANELVFPSPKGGYIHWNNFVKRAWPTVLSQAGVMYRNPYQMRHSFVSYCKETGISSIVIANWVGNSVTMVDKVYAHVTQDVQVPTL